MKSDIVPAEGQRHARSKQVPKSADDQKKKAAAIIRNGSPTENAGHQLGVGGEGGASVAALSTCCSTGCSRHRGSRLFVGGPFGNLTPPRQLTLASIGQLVPGLRHLLKLLAMRWGSGSSHFATLGGVPKVAFDFLHSRRPMLGRRARRGDQLWRPAHGKL